MNKVFTPEAQVIVYKNRLYDVQLSAEPSSVAQPLFVFAGAMATGEFVAGAMCGTHICLRAHGYSHVDTGIVAKGRPYIRNGKILYIGDDGVLKIGDIDYAALTSSGTVITNISNVSNGPYNDSMCYLDSEMKWHILEYDDGGLRVQSQTVGKSPLRLYPKKKRNFLHQFNAAIVKHDDALSALFTTDADGVVLYRHAKTWEHQRVAQDADLSKFIIDGAFDIGGKAFVFGRYKRTDEYDDGTVDYVVLPLIDDIVAMPAFAYAWMSSEKDWPFAVAVNGENLIITDFNTSGVIQIPEYIYRTVGTSFRSETFLGSQWTKMAMSM
jgi:hypothetical protein